MNQKIYNLEEFASRYHLKDIFGAYAAHFAVTRQESGDFADMVTERALFCRIFLVKQGSCRMVINGKDGDVLELGEGSMLMVSVNDVATLLSVSPDIDAECVLVDEEFVSQTYCFRLSADKYKSVLDIFHFIRDIVRHQHINKIEMIRSMFNVLKLIIEELPYEQCSVSHDIGHKKGIYEIFLHHLYRNFRKERQIRFYADKLNVSTVYLSRMVKEISGTTVNDHATSLVYKEICNLLTLSDMTIGEIADYLNFSDQSALSNFFKQRSGMTPLAYRNRQ
ncbi:helix-turn-helix domain-containing protein [Prevotella pectinovora]|mgnify:FL=1|jgi:transcriptional regulator, araC family|uniref:helix-turn-helix domain-containing protein n=1 Tax=Prevotella pectinovora TaxID=1602169 RepID=UPI002592979D|nr:helix-turn-helix domain-containing protein [uncultured Prevotella sp.]